MKEIEKSKLSKVDINLKVKKKKLKPETNKKESILSKDTNISTKSMKKTQHKEKEFKTQKSKKFFLDVDPLNTESCQPHFKNFNSKATGILGIRKNIEEREK